MKMRRKRRIQNSSSADIGMTAVLTKNAHRAFECYKQLPNKTIIYEKVTNICLENCFRN